MATNTRNTEHGAHGQVLDEDKLKQLALYIASRSEKDPDFASVKFNKLLFASDTFHYLKTGRSITGSAYIKKQFGPCPEDFDSIQAEMVRNGILAIQETRHFNYIQKRPIALALYDISSFSPEEIATVDEIIEDMKPLSGTQASNWSHEYVGWKIADEYTRIPYGLSRLGFNYELTDYHYELGREVAERVARRLGIAN